MSVFPTIVNDVVQIQHENPGNKTLYITSMMGKTVVRKIAPDGYVNLSDLNAGMYLLLLKEGEQTYTAKIIKE